MLTGVTVSSETIPAARIYFCILARCNQRASIRTNVSKGDRLTFDVETTRDGKTRASNVRQG
jgi:hypothetical protein